jgi:hypothetical protein
MEEFSAIAALMVAVTNSCQQVSGLTKDFLPRLSTSCRRLFVGLHKCHVTP